MGKRVSSCSRLGCRLVYGGSAVPAAVQGPQRTRRPSARKFPVTKPSRATTAAAYWLHEGVKRQRTPPLWSQGESQAW